MDNYNFLEDFRKGLVPNLITFAGLILIIPVFIVLNYRGYIIESLLIFVLGWILDGVDGKIARILKMESVIGSFFDPIADKLATWAHIIYYGFWLSAIIALGAYFIPIYILIGIIIFALGISLTISRIYMLINRHLMKKGKTISAISVGKLKTNFERSAICLLIMNQIWIHYKGISDFPIYSIYFCIFILLISIIFAFHSLKKQLKKIKRKSCN